MDVNGPTARELEIAAVGEELAQTQRKLTAVAAQEHAAWAPAVILNHAH